jgi:lipoate-protein ligase A
MMSTKCMSKPSFPSHIEDKIFEIKYSDENVSKITSYFPLTNYEKQEILSFLDNDFSEFHSIFSDNVSDEEWNRTKEQIKKRFNDELFGIDKKS